MTLTNKLFYFFSDRMYDFAISYAWIKQKTSIRFKICFCNLGNDIFYNFMEDLYLWFHITVTNLENL